MWCNHSNCAIKNCNCIATLWDFCIGKSYLRHRNGCLVGGGQLSHSSPLIVILKCGLCVRVVSPIFLCPKGFPKTISAIWHVISDIHILASGDCIVWKRHLAEHLKTAPCLFFQAINIWSLYIVSSSTYVCVGELSSKQNTGLTWALVWDHMCI